DVDPVKRYRMTQRNEVRGSLGRGDARQPSGDEGIPLGTAGHLERLQHLRIEANRCARPCNARGHRLVRNVDHARPALRAEVAEPPLRHDGSPNKMASYDRLGSAASSPSGTTSNAFASAIGRSWADPWPPADRARV